VKDLYGRTVARISCGGIDANTEQVSRGVAWIYRQYAKDHHLYIFEQEAKRFKRGLWATSRRPAMGLAKDETLCFNSGNAIWITWLNFSSICN
jgi:endonuclease YncB( thermonuclease family)